MMKSEGAQILLPTGIHLDLYEIIALDYKDFRDAENIMPLATSDFRNPICQELRSLRYIGGSGGSGGCGGSAGSGDVGMEQFGLSLIETKTPTIQLTETLNYVRTYNEQASGYMKAYNEQGSVDSSDTYASCQTHPSHSQGDLTEEPDSNLYVNPLEATEKCGTGGVRKSISCEVGRNIIADVSPSMESLKKIQSPNEAITKVTLNDTIPKHRKIRIQQSTKPQAQFISDQESATASSNLKENITRDNNNHYGGLRGGRSSTFMPTNNLVSATRIINHHLFGSISGSKYHAGTSTGSKRSLSLSADSIDSESVTFMDRNRQSRSILKKPDISNNYYSNVDDSDTEKLITDSVSTTSVCDNETSMSETFVTTSGTKTRKRPASPLLSRQVLQSIFRTNNNAVRDCDERDGKSSIARTSKIVFDGKRSYDEAVMDKQSKRSDEHQRRLKVRVQEESKQSQILRLYKNRSQQQTKKTSEDKRKTSSHSSTSYKSTDANCQPQYRFS